jgi:hypothetical protein
MTNLSRFKKGDKVVEMKEGYSVIYLVMESSDGWFKGVALQKYNAKDIEVGDVVDMDEDEVIRLYETVYV